MGRDRAAAKAAASSAANSTTPTRRPASLLSRRRYSAPFACEGGSERSERGMRADRREDRAQGLADTRHPPKRPRYRSASPRLTAFADPLHDVKGVMGNWTAARPSRIMRRAEFARQNRPANPPLPVRSAMAQYIYTMIGVSKIVPPNRTIIKLSLIHI